MSKRILLLTLMMLSITSTILFASESETQLIFRSDDGRYYLTEESVIAIANYIKQLEDLNKNYGAQIENLKKQIENLSQQTDLLKAENEKLKAELEQQRQQKLIWTVVATLAIGGVLYIFVK